MTTHSCSTIAAACTAALAAALAPDAALAQARNASLLSISRPNDAFNDVWGYHDAANDREYAILMSVSGTYIYNATDPTTPVLRTFIPASASGWQNSGWRDARVYRNYLYVVTEGGGGMQIIDLADPENPTLVKTWDGGLNWRDTHNICIDVDTGLCLPCGTSGGMHILDLSTDPENPVYITSYVTEYVHDLQVQDGVAHLAEINRDNYRLMDVTNLPALTQIGVTSINNAHAAWPTRDNRYAALCSEASGGDVTIVDLTTPTRPRAIQSYRTGAATTSVHNGQVEDRLVHLSYYSEGCRVLDLSNPAAPQEVGYFDTSAHTSGYRGNWGVYCFQPSGVVYASDRDNGLFILDFDAASSDYGAPTPGNSTPTLHTFGAAWLGNASFGLEIDDATPSAPAFVLIGTQRQDLNAFGLRVLVETMSAPAVVLSGTTDGDGELHLSIPVPNEPSLDGTELNAQGLVLDAGGPLGLAATAGKTFSIFTR